MFAGAGNSSTQKYLGHNQHAPVCCGQSNRNMKIYDRGVPRPFIDKVDVVQSKV